ncbi:MAG: acyl-CoA dehydrogenase family protein [Sporichthyaceae bacterium]
MAGTAPVKANLLYTDVEDDLRGTVRALLDKRADWSDVLARTESAEPTDLALWHSLAADIGCAGLAVAETYGGAGASWREVAVVAEELGRAVAPVPFLGSAVVATALLGELAPASPEAAKILEALAGGERVAAVAAPAGASAFHLTGSVTARQGGLHGLVGLVLDATTADVLLVPTSDGVFAVETDAPGVHVASVASLDMTRPLAEVALNGATGRQLAAPDDDRALRTALNVGAAVLASEQLGLAERCLALTLNYAKLRHQFGRPIGSFQAVKHRLADLWVALTSARAVARYAADCAATASPDLPTAAALAQAHCAPIAQYAAEECVQIHGGIGFTWEHPAHLYLKRAKADLLLLGTPGRHRAALAALVDLAPADPR